MNILNLHTWWVLFGRSLRLIRPIDTSFLEILTQRKVEVNLNEVIFTQANVV